MQADEARLRLLEVLIPAASKHALFGEPAQIIATCTQLEKYVLGWQPAGEEPTPAPRKTLSRPVRTTETQIPGFLDPTRGG
jgi:hypothetical protein